MSGVADVDSRAAFGPPIQAVSKGARSGSGVQNGGNTVAAEWKNAASWYLPLSNSSQNALRNRRLNFNTGPDANPSSAVRFASSSGTKRTAPAVSGGAWSTPNGKVTMAQLART